MAEIIDAFCERCGKAAVSPLAKAPASSRGLRRLLPGAKAKVETPLSALRLCLGCRGYVCDECWNEPASVCQSCQPLEGQAGVAPTVIDELMTAAGYDKAAPEHGMAFTNGDAWNGIDDTARLSALTSWPETDLRRSTGQPDAEAAGLAEPQDVDVAAADAGPGSAELAPEVEEALAAAEQPAADAFEDRWAELMNRVHAVGVGEQGEGVEAAEPQPEGEANAEQEGEVPAQADSESAVVADAAAAVLNEPAWVVEPELVDEPEWVVEPELVEEPEPVVEPELVDDLAGDTWFGLDERFDPESVYFDEAALAEAPVSASLPDAAEEPVELAETVAEEPRAVDEAVGYEEPVTVGEAVAEEPVAHEMAVAAEEPVVDELAVAAEEPVVDELAADQAWDETEVVAAAEAAAVEDPAYVEARWQAQAALSEMLENLHEVLEVASAEGATAEEPDKVEPALEADDLTSQADEHALEADEQADAPVVVAAASEQPASVVDVDVQAAPIEEQVDEQVAQRDPDEDLWAALLNDVAETAPDDHAEPDRAELDQVLRPRRVRRRIVRQTTRRAVQPSSAPAGPAAELPLPPPPPPAALEGPPATPAPPRLLRLPPVPAPRPPAAITPWPMPAPPAFLPPPPPSMLSNVQPAPARFRPQVAAAVQPVATPTTRPCLKCGLELSAKVAFCRRCGSRQTPA